MNPAVSPRQRDALTRRAIRVRGTVQGVGFRPSVYRLARDAHLGGFVRNDSEGVWIEIEGEAAAVSRFPDLLRSEAPPLSRIEEMEILEVTPIGETEFRVLASAARSETRASVPPDAATCEACCRELFDPDDRRYLYPFINCTDCGPRYTISRDVPYDRGRTTMDAFVQCPACLAEYEDPGDRRFHAEPNACPACGPRLELLEPGQDTVVGPQALARAARLLSEGRILAVKGLGGFHLAVDAGREQAVQRLRERKRRPHKPFALMARDLSVVERISWLDPAAREALLSPARPIVLLRPRHAEGVAESVAPALTELGVMLPYTPLHHLLLQAGPELLVLTSGNLSEEPIARENAEAVEKLTGIADAFLLHDRTIHTRADDSVVRVVAGGAQSVRRSRGFVPEPIALGFSGPPVLAVGGELKNTVCLTRGGEALLSPHVGDLDNPEAFGFFEEVIEKLARLLGARPEAVAHDLHPDYRSTRWALESRLARVAVQHHHAHIASCLAEHRHPGPVLGVAFDGTGCGPAGELWGGEFLLADLEGFRRLGHLRALALAGGERAIREPWRLAAAALTDAGVSLDCLARIDERRRGPVLRLLEKRVASPLSTGAGRWFDAVSALCGVRDAVSYEGQAAVELEAVSAREDLGSYRFDIVSGAEGLELDLRPVIRQIAAEVSGGVPTPVIGARFHATLAEMITGICQRQRAALGVGVVAFSGGCFQNRLLTEMAKSRLESDGFEVLIHRRVPPNDGGLALGQAAVAAYRLRSRKES